MGSHAHELPHVRGPGARCLRAGDRHLSAGQRRLNGFEAPKRCPWASRAMTWNTLAVPGLTLKLVSNPLLGLLAIRPRCEALAPPSSSHVATCVAPFQLA